MNFLNGAMRQVFHRSSDDAVRHGIERFSAFQQSLHIKGWVSASDITDLIFKLPSGAAHRLNRQPGKNEAFDQIVPIGTEDATAAVLEVNRRGKITTIANLGAPHGDAAHALYPRFVDEIRSRQGGSLLEVGSRARSGITRRDVVPASWRYTGMDVIDGPNVDAVGDAHELTRVFRDTRFDAVMSFSVLEHLAMPWKFSVELNRVLNVGAIGYIQTHQTWPTHEMPWDFWRFTASAWTSLFNPATGFEIIDAQMGEPAYIVPHRLHQSTNFQENSTGSLLSSVLFRKISTTTLDWPVTISDITDTTYPKL